METLSELQTRQQYHSLLAYTQITYTAPTKEEVLQQTSHNDEEIVVVNDKEEKCNSCFEAAETGVCCNTCEALISQYRKKGLSIRNVINRASVVSSKIKDEYIVCKL